MKTRKQCLLLFVQISCDTVPIDCARLDQLEGFARGLRRAFPEILRVDFKTQDTLDVEM